jgi:mevalonate pyrophosphate decarboxylase
MAMKKRVVSVAYPTIPIVFVSSVHPDRIPLHNTMGLSVTDLQGETRTETVVEVVPGGKGVEFYFDGKAIEREKLADAIKIVEIFRKESGQDAGIRVDSKNYKIYSGSSDAGAAAFVVALNELFETGFGIDRIAEISMMLSESSIRAVYGGMNELNVDGYPKFFGRLIASDQNLRDLKIFALTFDYETRVTAEQIFHATRGNPFYEYRLKMIPQWMAQIKLGLLNKDWHKVFSGAEENCANAHYLIESSGLRCRRKEMMNTCIDVEEIRSKGLACYWTAGGGRVINVFSWGSDAEKVRKELESRGHKPVEYRVASGARVMKSE